MLGLTASASALSLSSYAETSVLASGRWVKISVSETGIYAISRATLSKWGFTDPSKVRVYGTGGANIADALTQANYVDDLPLVQSECTDDGSVVFYGVGPESWSATSNGVYVSKNNIYTNKGYYFLSDTDAAIPEMAKVGSPTLPSATSAYAVRFVEHLQHEQDITTINETGGELVGEDFRYTPSRTFSFKLPGTRSDNEVIMECSFAAYTPTTNSRLSFTANGAAITSTSSDIIASTSVDDVYAAITSTAHSFSASGQNLSIGITHSSSGTISGAWLNYLAINYNRDLTLDGTDGYLLFSLSKSFKLSGATSNTRVWDVTNPQSIYLANTSDATDGTAVYCSPYATLHNYVAWTPDAKMPEPAYEGVVANQDLHANTGTEMVIFTPAAWQSQAERIAALHRAEGMDVTVVDVEQIYNEFGSGTAHIGAMRRYLKMLYDRGKAGDKQLKYVLLLGRATYDNRHNTDYMKDAAPTLPMWYSSTLRTSISDYEGYGTDDFLAMLDDGSGTSFGSDKLSVAVGRLPFTSLTNATSYVDKLVQYVNSSKKGIWRNNIMLLADDADSGAHMQQTENFANAILNTENQQFLLNKVYIDAYEKTNGNYPQAREDMFRLLDEGTMWWNYVGHANNHAWTHEGQLTYTDINNMYLNRLPVLYAATCNFLRWDSNTQSGGEILLFERYGGTIATISATRPVYIYYNGLLTEAMGRYFGTRDDNGNYHRLGEIYRLAKNDIRDNNNPISETNHLRYVLMGDPALQLLTPNNVVRLESVNGEAVDGDNQPCVAARQCATFEGSVVDPFGNPLSDFNGYVNATIYDAETSTTTNGNRSNNTEGSEFTFDHHGNRLFAGSALVKDGKFSLQVNMPAEIAENFRPATINMYALSSDNATEAVGVNSQFYVYGYDESTEADTEAPAINSFYINHSSFKDGDAVNEDPMAIAEVSDNRGINLSLAGIGHQMVLILDGNTTYSDVAQYYTPSTDGSVSGTINYPLSSISTGKHTLSLRVWDTDGNAQTSTLNFEVKANVAPKIYDIWTDSNPASTQANFYLSHDRPDQMATVTVTVYNLLGQPVWSSSVTGMSDMFTSTPVTWNLCDAAGRRVQRGIYIYKATISCDGNTYDTASKRIAVTN
jgi:hypothetical protein